MNNLTIFSILLNPINLKSKFKKISRRGSRRICCFAAEDGKKCVKNYDACKKIFRLVALPLSLPT